MSDAFVDVIDKLAIAWRVWRERSAGNDGDAELTAAFQEADLVWEAHDHTPGGYAGSPCEAADQKIMATRAKTLEGILRKHRELARIIENDADTCPYMVGMAKSILTDLELLAA